MKNICVIGLGNMGKAIYKILDSKKLYKLYGCGKRDNLHSCVEKCEIVFICVKPQSFKSLGKMDFSGKIVISIMAGVSIANIKKTLGVEKVVRLMPNLPLIVGRSVGGFTFSDEMDNKERKSIGKIITLLGEHIYVKHEAQIDAVTALSGSGPAYFYYIAELMEDAAKEMGFSAGNARSLAAETLIGAARYLQVSGESAKALRKKVSSKGGTTEAAINSLKAAKFDKIFIDAVKAAEKRAKELNK
ncbi:pyrroline-5-carboxylate reductase [Candidatus Gracilibacteria bacterium]|nr:pyrroline-5-carboxylate reductase [Candidatus Gracilibacteria bacterium]